MISFTFFVCQPMNVPLALVEKRVFFLWQFLPFGDGKKGAANHTMDFFFKRKAQSIWSLFSEIARFRLKILACRQNIVGCQKICTFLSAL
jgi:hypothetical protein